MSARPRLNGDVLAVAVARLAQIKCERGKVSDGAIRDAARVLGRSERQIRRLIAAHLAAESGMPAPGLPDSWTPDTEAVELYYRYAGNVARVHHELQASRPATVSLSTMRRAFIKHLSPAERAYAREGFEGLRRHRLSLPMVSPRRNAELQGDHQKWDLLVIHPDYDKPVCLWLTWFIETYSRAVAGFCFSVSPQPSQAEVLTALFQAIRIDETRGPFGGIPEVIRVDNGLEFLADSVIEAGMALGIAVHVCDPYEPQQKGKVERAHRTVNDEFLLGLPGHTHGPRGKDRKLYGNPADLLTFEEVLRRFEQWVWHYNTQRAHSALGARTPLAAFQEADTPLNVMADEQLWWLLLKRETRKISKEGISFAGRNYVAAELAALVGETVHIRYAPGDQRILKVSYPNDANRFLCDAMPADEASAEMRQQIWRTRAEQARTLSARRAAQTRKARRRRTPATGAGQLGEHGDVISVAQARAERPDGRDRKAPHVAPEVLGLDGDYDIWKPSS